MGGAPLRAGGADPVPVPRQGAGRPHHRLLRAGVPPVEALGDVRDDNAGHGRLYRGRVDPHVPGERARAHCIVGKGRGRVFVPPVFALRMWFGQRNDGGRVRVCTCGAMRDLLILSCRGFAVCVFGRGGGGGSSR